MYTLLTGEVNSRVTKVIKPEVKEFEDFIEASNQAKKVAKTRIAMIANSNQKIIFGWAGSSKNNTAENPRILAILQKIFDQYREENS